MTPRTWIIIGLAGALLAGYSTYALAPLPAGGDASTVNAGTVATVKNAHDTPTVLEWEGYLRAGPADAFAHTRETEPVVEPLAKMGFRLEVPEGTRDLVFRLQWDGDADPHLMVHAPHAEDGSMPTFMQAPDGDGVCLRIPADDLAPGTWQVMAHERDAVDVTIRITSTLRGGEGAHLVDGPHGHGMNEDMRMDMQEGASCAGA